jgi:hypothetical protein
LRNPKVGERRRGEKRRRNRLGKGKPKLQTEEREKIFFLTHTHEPECHSVLQEGPALLPFQSREPPPPSTSLGTKKKYKKNEVVE